MPDRVIEQEDAGTFRASVLAAMHDITIEQARALKDTGTLLIPEKTKPKKKDDEVSE